MSQATPPPSGYLNRKVAQSVEEAVSKYSVDHIKTIVKSAIQRYIESFMSRQGGNRQLFESFTKLGIQYITEHSFDPASDVTMRKVQLARLFEQLRQELPAILIMDAEFTYIPANFTGLESVRILNGKWYGTVQIVRQLTISVVAATRDQSSTDFLHGLLSVMFGEMKFLGAGTLMTGNRNEGESWTMTMGSPKLGTIEKTPVTEDPKDRIYSFSIDIPDIIFDDHVVIQQNIDRLGGIGPGVMNPGTDLGLTAPLIYLDDTIPINESRQVMFDLFQPLHHKVIIADPNIATYEPKSSTLYPRRLGTTELQVVRLKVDPKPQLLNQQDAGALEVVARKSVRIVAGS